MSDHRDVQSTILLRPELFGEKERSFLKHGSLEVRTFRFDSGVCALRLVSEAANVVLLPYQGQQIWSAEFAGRNVTMRSMFEEPVPTRSYLETYGGFLLHCGMTAMGVPAAGDDHPLHGELPNAPFQSAHVVAGHDERGAFVGVTGSYRHTVAFTTNYEARPLVVLHEGCAGIDVRLDVQNLRRSPMPFMYMAHVNFRPIDNGRLVYSAPCTPETVRVRSEVPSHISPPAGYQAFLDRLARDPALHHVLKPGLAFDPEVVLYVDYRTDSDGWAHSMQVHPDGTADYIAHRPTELPTGVRWICRTADQDGLGIVLPSTAEPEGRSAAAARGKIESLPPGGTFSCRLDIGVLNRERVATMKRRIDDALGTAERADPLHPGGTNGTPPIR